MSLFRADPPLLPDIIRWQGQWLLDKPAVIFQDKITSWQEFDKITNKLGNELLGRGFSRGSRVVVLMENTDKMIFSLFGVIKSGACVVPVNLAVSDEALAIQIKDSHAKVIIASEFQAVRIDGLIQAKLLLDNFVLIADGNASESWLNWDNVVSGASRRAINVPLEGNDECNVIYSSGTTGMPKGIVHSHRARLDWAYDLSIALKYETDTISICSLGLYSNISWVAMLSCILVGGCMVVQRKFNPEDFLRLVAKHNVTHCAGVPIQFQRIIDSPEFDPSLVSSIKTSMCCGSPLNESLKIRYQEQFNGALIELYGLTEGVITTLAPEDCVVAGKSVGRPLIGTEIQILSDSNQLVKNNEIGEIIGRGRIMMKGYLNRPDADEEASWIDGEGNTWLRTGDIGRIDEKGFLYLVDRKKDMIISGGQNIYPQDLEKALLQHESVIEAAVIGVSCKKWGETPLGLVVVNNPTESLENICSWANLKLGRQQKISRLIAVDKLARNPNGKILKKILREEFDS